MYFDHFSLDIGKGKIMLPNHSFSLTGNVYVRVSDQNNILIIELVECRPDTIKSLQKLCFSTSVWYSFINVMHSLDLPSYSANLIIVEDTLILSMRFKGDVPYITFQRYGVRMDGSKYFLPGFFQLSESQWGKLKDVSHEITMYAIQYKLKHMFKKLLQTEVQEKIPNVEPFKNYPELESVLIASLIDLLKDTYIIGIRELIVCEGCEKESINLLEHSCKIYNSGVLLQYYGDWVMLDFDLEAFVNNFIERNRQIGHSMNEPFIHNLDMDCILKNAQDWYVMNDCLELF